MALRDLRPRRPGSLLAAAAAVAATLVGAALARPTADSVTITSGPPSSTTQTSATFTFVGTGAATHFRCALDSAAAAPCTSPHSYSGLATGTHTFAVFGYRGDVPVGVSDRRQWTITAPSPPPPAPPPPSPSPSPPPPPPSPSPPPPVSDLPPLARAIVGTSGDDELSGTPGPDVILALGGDDAIEGLGGDDVIVGGPGRDRIDGGPGNDRLIGGAGRDSIWGDTGNDSILVVDDELDTSVQGGPGRDRVTRDRVDRRNRISAEVIRAVLGGPIALSRQNAIWTMEVDGGNLRRITLKKTLPGVADSDPKWSPDGTRIAFQRTTTKSGTWSTDIWVVNWDGTGATNATSSPAYREQSPAWSPDGSRIAFFVEESGGSDEWLAHRALAPGSPLWSVTGRNDFEDVEWRADGKYLYGGTCTGATGYLVRAAPWGLPTTTGFDKVPGEAVTDPGPERCDGELSTAASAPQTLLFARSDRGFFSGSGTSIIRQRSDGGPVGDPGAPVVVPPVAFGGSDKGGTMPDWNGAGTGFVFVGPGGVWRAAAVGFPRKHLGAGSQPDWR